MDLALNNLQKLICCKTQTTNQPSNLWSIPDICASTKSQFGTGHRLLIDAAFQHPGT